MNLSALSLRGFLNNQLVSVIHHPASYFINALILSQSAASKPESAKLGF